MKKARSNKKERPWQGRGVGKRKFKEEVGKGHKQRGLGLKRVQRSQGLVARVNIKFNNRYIS